MKIFSLSMIVCLALCAVSSNATETSETRQRTLFESLQSVHERTGANFVFVNTEGAGEAPAKPAASAPAGIDALAGQYGRVVKRVDGVMVLEQAFTLEGAGLQPLKGLMERILQEYPAALDEVGAAVRSEATVMKQQRGEFSVNVASLSPAERAHAESLMRGLQISRASGPMANLARSLGLRPEPPSFLLKNFPPGQTRPAPTR